MARHDGWRNSPSRGNPRKKKNFLSYPVNSRRRARERHRVLGKGRARATHERKLTERNAVCEERTDPR